MSWRDRNSKFGPNCDLEVDDLEKKLKIWRGEAESIFYFLVEIRSWRDRNLKFGPNCDLEVDSLE